MPKDGIWQQWLLQNGKEPSGSRKERTFLTRSATNSLRLMDCAMDLSSEKAYPNMIFIFQMPSFANVCPSTVCICIYFRYKKKKNYSFHLSCSSYYKTLLKSFATYRKTLLTEVMRNTQHFSPSNHDTQYIRIHFL